VSDSRSIFARKLPGSGHRWHRTAKDWAHGCCHASDEPCAGAAQCLCTTVMPGNLPGNAYQRSIPAALRYVLQGQLGAPRTQGQMAPLRATHHTVGSASAADAEAQLTALATTPGRVHPSLASSASGRFRSSRRPPARDRRLWLHLSAPLPRGVGLSSDCRPLSRAATASSSASSAAKLQSLASARQRRRRSCRQDKPSLLGSKNVPLSECSDRDPPIHTG